MVRGEVVGWPISGNRIAFVKSIHKADYFGVPTFYVSFVDQRGFPLAGLHVPRGSEQVLPKTSDVATCLEGI